MTKRWFAADNSYGTNFTYDSPGWCVNVFDSKAERDTWVNEDAYPNGNPTRETIKAKQAKKICNDEDYWYIHHGDQVAQAIDIINR